MCTITISLTAALPCLKQSRKIMRMKHEYTNVELHTYRHTCECMHILRYSLQTYFPHLLTTEYKY